MLDACSLIIIIGIIVLVYILYLYFKCKRLEKILHRVEIIVSAHKTVLINKVVGFTGDTRDIHEIARELDEEVIECYVFLSKHEEEMRKRCDEDGFVTIDKEEDK